MGPNRTDMRDSARILFTAGMLAALLTPTACGNGEEQPPDTPPRQISTVSPFHYPEELWDAEVEGETTLRIRVNEEGAVDSAVVEQTSGYPAFDSAAVEGAHRLRFEPARRGDEPVSGWVLLPVQFELSTAEAQNEETR